jgi:hypothetical protein
MTENSRMLNSEKEKKNFWGEENGGENEMQKKKKIKWGKTMLNVVFLIISSAFLLLLKVNWSHQIKEKKKKI